MIVKNKIKYFNHAALILLLLFTACKKSTSNNTGTQNEAAVAVDIPGVYFTELAKVSVGQASPVIMNKLIEMINATPKSAHIYLSIFGFDHTGIIDALKAAAERGVLLHIMIDSSIDDTRTQNMATINRVRSFIKSGSQLSVVSNDVNESSINHNKFVLFSELNTTKGKATNVVFQTSHNFTVDDSKKIQDAVTLSNEGLYTAYLNYWKDINTRAMAGMKDFEYREYNGTSDGITGFFFPKKKSGTNYGNDTVIELLDNITDLPNATIQVGMSDWVVSRINVANKLSELLAKGAKIEVVVKNKIDVEVQNVLKDMQTRGATIKMYNISQTNIHSKFMLINGKYKGEQCKIVATGSHNYTTNALRNNNETLLLLKNYDAIFNAYQTYYSAMKQLPGIN